jgi:hypothetical protein
MIEVRKLAELGMQTEVTIYARSEATPPADDYGDDYLDFSETNESRKGTVKGWFYSVPADTQDVDTGMVVTTNTYRLLVPVGTDIDPGDKVTVGADEYIVSDTDREGTWLPMLTCHLRKRE